jgi:transketolase
MPTLKPFDNDAVLELAGRVDRLVTVENHYRAGGLGTAVAETLADHGVGKRLHRIGLPDRHIECGAVATLQERYGLTVDRIVDAISGAPEQG